MGIPIPEALAGGIMRRFGDAAEDGVEENAGESADLLERSISVMRQ